ncbi:hypothetical protein EVAR_8659_1 [Eumeta japonica]|uniref:Uncharacterized protein n=1 Tax=Eumeta variegata TaxID=151549 RepID=A0A4C1TUI1_EUMVA|nr:hypothetical protein EVAR_8659_1 [Eumeta japonica]
MHLRPTTAQWLSDARNVKLQCLSLRLNDVFGTELNISIVPSLKSKGKHRDKTRVSETVYRIFQSHAKSRTWIVSTRRDCGVSVVLMGHISSLSGPSSRPPGFRPALV